ncbi:MAG: ZPR1 zinc finger domain-containing protein [Candidatus Altiarchaeota archaeon]|nr:ZPR1 zinc finger domain-containing protein [Candidatus Altiarchaeota archaeon]
MQGKLNCPVCTKMIHFTVIDKIDFMGEGVSLFAFNCECGYKGVDIFPEKMNKPRRITFKVNNKNDLNTLVAKSSTGSISIPEIGLSVRPGPASSGYITTIEGVLSRIKQAMGAKGNAVNKLLATPIFTLIIEDVAGTSAIDSSEAQIDILNDTYVFKP